MIGINVPISVPMAFFSFGGWKQSLFGDLHVHGIEGIKFYSRTKPITRRWTTGAPSNAAFHMPQLG
jgi:malonate-semialdehyde dehydrogenase (acetylating)/methylmalonate-semialdehyde dehydrogenase